MDLLQKAPLDKNATVDHATALGYAMVIGRSAAANALSLSGRHELINFGRVYAAFTPKYEQGWNPDPIPKPPSFLRRLLQKR